MRASVAAICFSVVGLSSAADTQATARKQTNIHAQALGPALQRLAKEHQFQLIYVSEEVGALRTSGAIGEYTAEEALRELLAGTGLTFKYLDERTVTIVRHSPTDTTPSGTNHDGAAKQTDSRDAQVRGRPAARGARFASATSAILLGLAAANPSPAQTAGAAGQENNLEEIVVTGIRGSLRRATEIKRSSDQIVDSIASESLGKFPDTNIAESLQRITGVSIDRSGGEGQAVTVRGFGPEFNTVLLNGRRMASDTGARSFNFDVLPAELISRVDVYKSAAVHLQEGGIGSTIVMHTPQPLDIGGFKAMTSARALYEDLSEEVTPQVFGMISDTFADDRAGFLISASYQRRKNLIERFLRDGYLTAPRDSLTLIKDELAAQGYAAEDQFFIPQNLNISPIDQDRERTNFNATLQLQPTDDLRITLDAMYDEFTVFSQTNALTFFVTPAIITDAAFDENRTAISLTQTVDAAVDFTRSVLNRPTDTYATGLNLDWALNDSWNLAFDSSWSRAESGGASGTDVVVIGFRNERDIYTLLTGPDGTPAVTGYRDEDVVDPSLARAHFTLRGTGGGPLGGGADFEDELFEQKLEATWQPDYEHLKRVSFGAFYSTEEQSTTSRLSDNEVLCLYCGYFVDVPDELMRPFRPRSGYLGGRISVPPAWQTFDIDEAIGYLESPEAAAARDAALGLAPGTTQAVLDEHEGFDLHVRPSSTSIEEDVWSFYADANFQGAIGEMPWDLTLGARYVRTETTAFGISEPLLDLVNSGDPTLFLTVLGEGTSVSETNTYDNVLPSLSFRLNLTDDLLVRFAASKTLTRPPLGALSPRLVIGTTRPGNLQASSGNPDLKPFMSKNADLSLEWYYQENGFLTLGLFYKDVDNFLVNTVENRALPILDSQDLFEGDPVFEISLQDNLESARVKGAEIGFQHTFDWLPGFWSGFGITANATLVDSNAELNVEDVSQTFALEGLGDSYNVIGFYENGPVEIRVAWNRRDRFLQNSVGFGGEPTYVEPFEQIDARASFAIGENLSVFAEGVNIGNERTKKVGRYRNQILLLEETGARYSVGVRVEF